MRVSLILEGVERWDVDGKEHEADKMRTTNDTE
jgi:hypothetical protein